MNWATSSDPIHGRFLFRQPQSIHIMISPPSFGQRVTTLKRNLCRPTPDVSPLSIADIETGNKLNPLLFQTTGRLRNQFNINNCLLQRLSWHFTHQTCDKERQTDRQTGDTLLTISTLCSRCRWQECPAVCTGQTSWLCTWKWDVAAGLIQRENGGLSQLILPLATSSNGAHGRAAGAAARRGAERLSIGCGHPLPRWSRTHRGYICPADDLPAKPLWSILLLT